MATQVNRNLPFSVGLLATACAWWAIRSLSGDPPVATETRGGLEATRDSTVPTQVVTQPVEVERAAAPREWLDSEFQFQQYVDDKYRALFHDVDGAARGALRGALRERERVVAQINTSKQADDAVAKEGLPALEARKAELDRGIGLLLPPGELAGFDALKDADIERFQVDDYAAGIANIAPLSDADKQAVLATKLAYRERFRRVLADSRLMSGDLDAAERRLAFAEVSRALRQYRDSYLQEVRQYLYNDEQYAPLANYENSEYDAELAKLRGIAGLE